MRTPLILVPVLVFAGLLSCATVERAAPAPSSDPAAWPALALQDAAAEPAGDGHGVGHALLFYIPNRVFDVFDIVRARVRLGPGAGISVRATELADVTVGAYTSFFVGLHGHRGFPQIPWPLGFENLAKAEVSVIDSAPGGSSDGPNYGPFEFGLGAHGLIVGLDIGIEPFEILDLVTGLVFLDLVGDDY